MKTQVPPQTAASKHIDQESPRRHWRNLAIALLASIVSLAALGSTPALANIPAWSLRTVVGPRNLPPGGTGVITVDATNVGDADIAATFPELMKITDKLPVGLTATAMRVFSGFEKGGWFGFCNVETVSCLALGTVEPAETMQIEIEVSVGSEVVAPSTGSNEVNVSGGNAASVADTETVNFDSTSAGFGVQQFEQVALNENGSLDTQAGSHPFQYVTTIQLNEETSNLPKDLHFALPPGVIGNATVVPQCSFDQFSAFVPATLFAANLCPADTAIGVATVWIFGEREKSMAAYLAPLFNLVPDVGEPARLGFMVFGVPVILDTAIRTGSDYGVLVNVNNINTNANFGASQVTIWGAPADPRHDESRGNACIFEDAHLPCTASPPNQAKAPPFLTLPTSCTGPLHSSVEADSWKEQGVFQSGEYTLHNNVGPLEMDGCNRLPFEPSIRVTPDGQVGSTPTGLNVDEHVPQQATLNPEGLAESDVKGLTVRLPEGVALNPSAADGLMACSEAQIGLQSGEASSCPEAAKVATVKIKTPLLPDPLTGAAYLAAQDQNPFGSLVALYVYAEDPISGVRAKAAGEVVEDPSTGQLTAHFERDPAFSAKGETTQFLPQLAFEDIELHFFGGARAPLGTPARCGSYTTTGTFLPWSGNPQTESSSTFQIVSGANGSSCPGPALPFAPSLTAGTTSIQAGGFSPFTTTFSRADGNQNLQAIQLHLPPGLSGTLTGVKLCNEVDANAGTCGPESLIGETIVSVGLGGSPFSVTGGRVYITEKYHGAPFGLSIVNPAKAGPFDLGQVIVRAKVEIDPITSALTVTTDSSGPHAIPHILDGIPLEIQHVNVTINRPDFTFNPTNCNRTAITGSLSSAEGTTSALSLPFQVTNCAALQFEPQFSVSTSGLVSRTNGTSLDVKLSYPKAPFGTQANVKKVRVELPKQLPARLTTLQKACTAAVFNAGPAGCPAASKVGEAIATSPLVPVPLSGPAYFVSNGGAAFPELILVLSGYGVTVDLHGETFISKAGVTSSTFNTIPDVPIESFDLKLPAGPDSALAANGNPCASKLTMPTSFVAQNGATLTQQTPIAVEGCTPAIRVVGHSIKGSRASIRVAVPSAGVLVASGGGIDGSFRRVAKAGIVTIGVRLDSHGLRVLAKNPRERLNADVKLRLTPKHGSPLTAHVKLLMG